MATEISGSTGVNKIQDGTVVNADIDTLDASKLTGTVADARISALTASKLTGALPAISAANLTSIPAANITGTLPAIDGSNLTGVSGGKVLQVVGGTDQATTNITSTSFSNSGSSLSITPSATSSKILVLFSGHPRMYSATQSAQSIWTLYRGSTNLGDSASGFFYPYVHAAGSWDSKTVSICHLDSPNTTSSVTYTIYAKMLYSNSRCQLATGSSYNQWTLLEIGV